MTKLKLVELLVIVVICLLSGSIQSEGKEKDVSKILDKIFEGYDRRIRPKFGGDAVHVEINGYVLDLFNVDEQNHEFSVTMYFRQHWNDPGVTYEPPPGIESITVDPEHAKKLWTPDTFIVNERKTTHHSVGNSIQEFTRIEPDGDILKSSRLTICASCKMNLGYYPFDRQLCTLEIESYGFTANDFIYSWKHGKNSVGISNQASSLKFYVAGMNLKGETIGLGTRNYSRLSIEFFLIRNSARDVQDRYTPAFILTVISFFTLFVGTFLLRTQMSLLIVATMILFMGLNNPSMPKVSYQTALDLYIFACFLTIVNVVVVNFLMLYFYKPTGRKPTRSVRMERLEETNHAGDDKEILCTDDSEGLQPQLNTKFEEILHKICEKSKYTVPLGFLVFNLIYWMVVLIGSSSFPEDFLIIERRE